MMSIKQKLTGKPSIDRPWMQYYPQEMIENLTVPNSTLYEYLMYNCPGDDVVAIHYYGRDITWKQIKEETDKVARALKAVGFGENDEIPMFLRSVPEFIFLLLGAEKIGASLLCRDNTIEENVAAVKKAGAKIIFAHDFLSHVTVNDIPVNSLSSSCCAETVLYSLTSVILSDPKSYLKILLLTLKYNALL